ncbi:hypothetical protein HYC85_032256 [Camellia sinensis]|uniref:Anaphase-promoting complex subunit 4 WD40 domain-containing protein n=1 Tax=Camellia sinensis TaxID=4442 RepID=A0A7J7FSM3_CAMSI|nr:hypothetical protein HYC85_032256 [Camellia sinensis]
MEATEMDVEEAEASLNTNSLKRFGLKNSIQTNFGDDYVFQIVPKYVPLSISVSVSVSLIAVCMDDWTLMAVSLSTNAVKLYSPITGQYFGECKGHSSTINQISFSGSTSPHLLHSSSSDASIRAWDTRSFQQVSCLSAGPSQEIFSFSLGGSGDNLLAAGSKSQEWNFNEQQSNGVTNWDLGNKKQIACLEESHMDDVTQVHFVPDHQNKLVSASVDGLMCIFDTGGNINDDDHLESVDYFVDCNYSGEDNLWVIGGTSAGTLGYFPVNCRGKGAIGSPEAILHGGHTGIVRSVLPMSGVPGWPTHSRGIFGWTGGEDGQLCCWSSDETSDVNRSWISSELVMKSPNSCRNSRHHPY